MPPAPRLEQVHDTGVPIRDARRYMMLRRHSGRNENLPGGTMANSHHTKVLIIGSGPAGYTAGVYASRAMLEPILVQGIEPGGQLTTTTEVENWPGDTEVQGPDLMVRMEAHAKAMGCEIVGDIITELDLSQAPVHRHR